MNICIWNSPPICHRGIHNICHLVLIVQSVLASIHVLIPSQGNTPSCIMIRGFTSCPLTGTCGVISPMLTPSLGHTTQANSSTTATSSHPLQYKELLQAVVYLPSLSTFLFNHVALCCGDFFLKDVTGFPVHISKISLSCLFAVHSLILC